MLASLTVVFWLKQRQAVNVPQDIIEALIKALSRPKAERTPDGRLLVYAELTTQYSQTQRAVLNLLKKVIGNATEMLNYI